MDNTTSKPVVELGSHVVHPTASSVAAIFGKPIEAAESLKRRQESQLAAFYDSLVNDPQHLAKLVKRPTAAEKEKLPEVEGKKRPEVIAELVKLGYAVSTAEKMFSQMLRFREAYLALNVHYIPNQGTTWDQAYEQATSKLGERRKALTTAKKENAEGLFQATYVAQAVRRLDPEARKDAAKIGEATMQGIAEAEQAAIDKRIDKAVDEAWNAIGGQEYVERFIQAMRNKLQDWQTKQSTGQHDQPAGDGSATESPQGVSAPNQPARQVAA